MLKSAVCKKVKSDCKMNVALIYRATLPPNICILHRSSDVVFLLRQMIEPSGPMLCHDMSLSVSSGDIK